MDFTNVDENLKVEVKHGQRLFPAKVIDIHEGVVTVQYNDGTCEEIFVNPGRLRRAPTNKSHVIGQDKWAMLGQQIGHVELSTKATITTTNFSVNDNTTSLPLDCWELRKVMGVAQGNLLIISDGSDVPTATSVLDVNNHSFNQSVRLPNSDAHISGEDWSIDQCLFKFCHVNIESEHVQQLCMKDSSVNEQFCTQIGAVKIAYNNLNKRLVVISTNEQMVRERLDLFQSHHLRGLEKMAQLNKQVQDQENLLRDEKQQARFTDEIKISIELSKFGILERVKGKYYHGARTRKAKEVPGVLEVFVQVYPQGDGSSDSTGYVIIRLVCKTQEALDEAAGYLRFDEQVVCIPEKFTKRVIGNDGGLVQDLIDKCGIIRVAVASKDQIPADHEGQDVTPFKLIGLSSKINSAKALILYQISFLEKEDDLTEKLLKTQLEIKKVRGHFLNTDNETDALVTESDSGYRTHARVKLPHSWAVDEKPPPKSQMNEKKSPPRGILKGKKGNRTDGEYTDTEAGNQSDATPFQSTAGGGFAAVLRQSTNQTSPRSNLDNNNNNYPEAIPEAKSKLDKNNNVIKSNSNNLASGDNSNNKQMKPRKENGKDGGALPQRTRKPRQNNRNRQNKTNEDKTQQQPAVKTN